MEDKANGPAVIQALRHEIPGLVAVVPDGGKVARAQAVSPQVESCNVWRGIAVGAILDLMSPACASAPLAHKARDPTKICARLVEPAAHDSAVRGPGSPSPQRVAGAMGCSRQA